LSEYSTIGEVVGGFIETKMGTVKRSGEYCEVCGTELLEVQNRDTKLYSIQTCGRCAIENQKKGTTEDIREHTKKRAYIHQVDKKFIDKTWNDFKRKTKEQKYVYNNCRNWIERFNLGKWLVLYGGQGTGKTFLKNMILKDLARQGFNYESTTLRDMYSQYLEKQRNGESTKKLEERYASKSILFIDELGRASDTDSLKHFMFSIIDKIYIAKRSLILVSNMMIEADDESEEHDDKKKYISDFIDFERLKECATFIPFYGESYR